MGPAMREFMPLRQLVPVRQFVSVRQFAAALLCICMQATAAGQALVPVAPLWWPGFIDAKGKAFLELPGDTKLCATARDALRRARLKPGG